MSEDGLLICSPGFDAAESETSLERLRQIRLPRAIKVVVTAGKLQTDGIAKRINVDSDYPPEPAHLQTLLGWTGVSDLLDPRFRDGFDLYSLRRILAKYAQLEFAVMLRSGAAEFDLAWPELRSSLEQRAFKCFGGEGVPSQRNLVVHLRDPCVNSALKAAWQLYSSGAVYALAPYSFDAVMDAAVAATTADFQPAEPRFSEAEPSSTRVKTG